MRFVNASAVKKYVQDVAANKATLLPTEFRVEGRRICPFQSTYSLQEELWGVYRVANLQRCNEHDMVAKIIWTLNLSMDKLPYMQRGA